MDSERLSDRLEVRLDAEHRRKLDEIARARGKPASAVIRDAIDWAYETDQRREGLAAVERLRHAHLEDVPDPETLKRQLEEAHELPELY
jgi:predicted transcriptional regulator